MLVCSQCGIYPHSQAYERAEGIALNNRVDPHRVPVDPSYKLCVLELAKLYDLDKVTRDKAKGKYLKFVKCMESEAEHGTLSDNEIEALIKLSEIELEDGRFDEAVKYCQRIIKFGAKGKETAERILKQIQFHIKGKLRSGRGRDDGSGSSGSGMDEEEHQGSCMDMISGDGSSGHDLEEEEDDNDDMEISYIS